MMMTWCFSSLSTLLDSYADDEEVIIKKPMQWSAIHSTLPLAGFEQDLIVLSQECQLLGHLEACLPLENGNKIS